MEIKIMDVLPPECKAEEIVGKPILNQNRKVIGHITAICKNGIFGVIEDENIIKLLDIEMPISYDVSFFPSIYNKTAEYNIKRFGTCLPLPNIIVRIKEEINGTQS